SRKGTTLTAVGELVERGVRERRIPAVVTFNYDDLLEEELERRGVPHHVVAAPGRARGDGVPIVHPHGFLPRESPDEASGIVLTEDDYHRVGDAVFHWASGEIVHHLRHGTALFLGLSMSDPNLRRLLDAARVRGEIPAHWLVQRRKRAREEETADLH